MEKRLILISSLLFLLFTACSKDEEIVKTVPIDSFSGIVVNSSFDIILHRDSVNKIVLSGSSDVVDKVDISTEADTVVIENSFSAKWLRPRDNHVKLDIYCDSLSRVILNETCNLSSKDSLHAEEIGIIVGSKLNIVDLKFKAKTVFYWNNFPCSGTIKFRGLTDELKIWNTALMQVDASELISNYVLVENNSGEDCTVRANNHLDYSITGAGNIYVHGNPEISHPSENSGTGQLILLD